MKNLIGVICLAGLLAGCATTDSSSEIADTVYTGFSEASDGSMTQEMRGLVCEAEVNGMRLTRAELLQADGSDAFCNYVGENNKIYTVYLSDFPDWSPEEYFQASVNDTGSAMEQAGLEVDEALSEHCELSSIDVSSLLQAFTGMEDNTVVIEQSPAVVFTGPDRLSILTLMETTERQYLKLRYSLSGSGEADAEVACDFLRGQSLEHRENIRTASGKALSENEKMMRFLKAVSESEE